MADYISPPASDSRIPPIRMFLCGDVMTGRGIDQILSCPGDPQLHEAYVRDARQYVRLAEMAHGPIARAVKPAYIWGDALTELDRGLTDVRIINLETSITCSDGYWQGKGIHYRMHPRNIDCLTAARIDCCCLANNHILDWGYDGLAETIRTLDQAGIAHAGAGRDAAQAEAPAVLDVPGKGRVLVVSLGLASSGIPQEWAAARSRPGVNLLGDLTEKTACRIASGIAGFTKPGDVTVVSIHWGPNWGYEISDEERDFAGMLFEQGIDVVHGHSSHHVKPIEMPGSGLVLYGCGDFLNDYEGIQGHEEFRSDLALIHLASIDPGKKQAPGLRLFPLQMRNFRLNRATREDSLWLAGMLSRRGVGLGTSVHLEDDNTMTVRALADSGFPESKKARSVAGPRLFINAHSPQRIPNESGTTLNPPPGKSTGFAPRSSGIWK